MTTISQPKSSLDRKLNFTTCAQSTSIKSVAARASSNADVLIGSASIVRCQINMTLLMLIATLLITHLCLVAAQSSCSTPDGKSGKCISIYDCGSLLKLTKNPSPADQEFLRNSLCGFVSSTPKVCCPQNTCTTPDGTQGTCIGYYSCPLLVNMLKPSPTQEAIQYVQRSRCESSEQYSVCCGPRSNSGPKPNTSTAAGSGNTCQLTAFPPSPSTECCGVDASGGGNRIFGGTMTAVDEYPWLSIIEYLKDNRIKLLCGGVLISGRYVMTAGHCVVGPVLNAGTPVNVRLGEYDTSNPGSDCVEVEGGGQDCNDGALSIPIEKITAHPDYNPSSKLRRHDIALIRLSQLVEFSDFIRPVCLPTADFTLTPDTGSVTLFAAGWGAVSDNQSSSSIKLKVGLPYLSYQECQPSYSVPSRRVQLWDGQICAGGVNGKDSCKGDSGGPLMREKGKLLELVGIVSFGPTPCGMENVAGVYTKVYHYLPWIQSEIVD